MSSTTTKKYTPMWMYLVNKANTPKPETMAKKLFPNGPIINEKITTTTEEPKPTKESAPEKFTVRGDCFSCSEPTKAYLTSMDQIIICMSCHRTNTRNCKFCSSSFFSLGKEAILRSKYKNNFKAPACCSEKCHEQYQAEKYKTN
jgi:hypothetical protein